MNVTICAATSALQSAILGLDPVDFLAQPVHTTTSGKLVLLQQSDNRRHSRPPRERRIDDPSLPHRRRPYP
ncbi:hypothetical protein [Streptomyces sp. NPDC048445]|uniref:hypothetical protein n=1 Tax=Streptomyces sp. NPDC048445 TaxID=3365553 RepID=UPI003712F974